MNAAAKRRSGFEGFFEETITYSSITKATAALKMRGTGHDKGLREHETSMDGRVGATFKEHQLIMAGWPTRVASKKFATAFGGAAGKKAE
jgi:hypothetical protein